MEGPGTERGAIGIFDSGYGGLTILNEIQRLLPHYDYLYLGDNARAPYGTRSFEIVYQFTLQAVRYLFEKGCRLVILACNTASAKALRNIQQHDLPVLDPRRRVLGVIRPTVEALEKVTRNGNIGLVATPGTIASDSYKLEIAKLYPLYRLYSRACPMWVPLIENGESSSPGARYFIEKDLRALMEKCADIDTLILGCTHYPLIRDEIKTFLPADVRIIEQGKIVAESLKDYLQRHPEIERRCSAGGGIEYLTTEDPVRFDRNASRFLGKAVTSKQIILN